MNLNLVRSRRWRSGRRDSVGDQRHRRDVLYAQVNNAVYHFYIDDAVNLHLARSGVSNDGKHESAPEGDAATAAGLRRSV